MRSGSCDPKSSSNVVAADMSRASGRPRGPLDPDEADTREYCNPDARVGRASRLPASAFTGQAQREQRHRGEREREQAEPGAEVAGRLAQEAQRVRAGEAAEVPDRVDQRDPAGRGAAGEEAAGKRPERAEAAPDSGGGD